MMKSLILTWALLVSSFVQAAPPTGIKGQDGTINYSVNAIVPYNQATKLAGNNVLIETGNANVLADPGAEAATTPWSAYKDAAGVLPVDGTAGTALYVTCANSATSPLAGTKSFLITKTANDAQGEGCSIPFTIPTSSTYKVNRLSFDYAIASGTYTDDEIEWFVYDVTNGGTPKPFTPSKLKNHSLPSETFAPNGEFQASNSTSYRLIAHVAGTSASAYSLKFDNFKLGVFEKTYGRGDTEYSAVISSAGAVTTTSRSFIQSITDNGVGDYTVNFVTGAFSIAPSVKITPMLAGGSTGFASIVNTVTTAGFRYRTNVADSGGTTHTLTDIEVHVTASKQGTDYANASGLVMSNDADTRVVATRVHGATGTFGTSESTVIYPSVSYDSTGSYNTTTGEYIVKVSGKYRITNFLLGPSVATPLGSGSQGIVYKNGVVASYTSLAYSPAAATFRNTINGSAQIDCIAGDVLLVKFIFPVSAAIDQTGASLNWTTFERISGPSQIAASESVSALYTGAPPTGTLAAAFNTTTFGTKVTDSHNAYSGGAYTVPSNGTYYISASAAQTATYAVGKIADIAIFIDGAMLYRGYSEAGGANAALKPSISVGSIPLLKGQVVTIRSFNDATSPGFVSSANYNYFSITRTGNF